MTREEQINEAVNTYMNGLFEDGIEIPIEDFENIEEGFIAGAQWADNHPINVWHDVDEEPKEDIDILFISKSGNVHKVSKVDSQLYNWLKDNKDIKRWAYISDLLPKD